MTLVNAGYAWLLLLALTPVVIYLLMRLRVQRMRWGANYLLERALARLSGRRNWWVYVLLAARTLVIGLAVLALLGPVLLWRESGVVGDGTVLRVILVDDSYSMRARAGVSAEAATRRDRAMALAGSLVERWSPGEPYVVYGLAGGLRPVTERTTLDRPEALMSTLMSIPTRDGAVDLPAALTEVGGLAAGQPHEVVLIGDDQAINWAGFDAERHGLGEGGRGVVWVSPASGEEGEASANVFIEAVETPGRVIPRGELVRIGVRVRCGSDATGPQPVTVGLTIPNQVQQVQSGSVLPGQATRLAFDVRLLDPGATFATATLRNPDPLAWDNAASAAFVVAQRMRVAVVDDPRARAFDRAGDYLRVMSGAEAEGGGAMAFERVEGEALAARASAWADALSRGEVVGVGASGDAVPSVLFLDAGARVSAEAWRAISRYVHAGGGLVLSAGPGMAESLVTPSIWPARLSGANTLPTYGAASYSVEASSLTEPALRTLGEGDSGGVGVVDFYGYWSAEVTGGDAVLARFDTGEPWLVGGERGLGRVLVMTSGLSGQWNTLPVSTALPQVMHRLIAWAAAGRVPAMNVERGASRQVVAFAGREGATYVLTGPRGEVERPVVIPGAIVQRHGRPLVSFEGAVPRDGLYTARATGGSVAGGDEHYLAVYGSRDEGDTAGLKSATRSKIAEGLNVEWVRSIEDVEAYLSRRAGGTSLFLPVMALVAGLLVVESLLTWKVGP